MMGRALTFRRRKEWGCSGFRSVLPALEESTKFTRSRNAEQYCPWNCPSLKRTQAHTPMKQIRILLADDHTVMRRGLRLLLESHPQFGVIAEAADGRQAVEQAEATEPDVAVLDIAIPNLNGIEAAQRIHAALPNTAIVILSMHSDEGYA